MSKLMKGLIVSSGFHSLSISDLPIPIPEADQVLIKVNVTPVTQSDIDSFRSPSGSSSSTPGIEGSGTIIQGTHSVFSRKHKGKKVSFIQLNSSLPGAWAEYVICSEKYCMVLNDDIDFLRGATLLFNPLMVLLMNEKIKKKKHKAVIHTNASTDLGVVFIKWCHYNEIPAVHIVKTDEELRRIKSLGTENVLISESQNFLEELKDLCETVKPTCAFDSLGGRIAGEIFNKLPENSEMFVYGNPKEIISGIDSSELIFKGKSLKGLKFKEWLDGLNALKRMKYFNKIQKVNFVFCSIIANVYPISEFNQAISTFRPLGYNLLHFACDLSIKSENLIEHYMSPGLLARVKSISLPVQKDPDAPLHVLYSGIYKGDLMNDKPHAQGSLLIGTTYYIGSFINGIRQGKGMLITEDYYYSGDFANDQINGNGEFFTFEGGKLEGSFVNGFAEGLGKETLNNGEIYIGEFKNSKRHGKGEIRYEGIYFSGSFSEGEACGEGRLELVDGSIFVGKYTKNVGVGELKKSDGSILSGTVVGNVFCETITGKSS